MNQDEFFIGVSYSASNRPTAMKIMNWLCDHKYNVTRSLVNDKIALLIVILSRNYSRLQDLEEFYKKNKHIIFINTEQDYKPNEVRKFLNNNICVRMDKDISSCMRKVHQILLQIKFQKIPLCYPINKGDILLIVDIMNNVGNDNSGEYLSEKEINFMTWMILISNINMDIVNSINADFTSNYCLKLRNRFLNQWSQRSSKMMKWDVFINYNCANSKIVFQIYNYLQQHNLKVWIDMKQIPNNFDSSIEEFVLDGLVNSKHVLMCLSKEYQMNSINRTIHSVISDKNENKIKLINLEKDLKYENWLIYELSDKKMDSITNVSNLQFSLINRMLSDYGTKSLTYEDTNSLETKFVDDKQVDRKFKWDLFLSYCHDDRDIVKKVYDNLIDLKYKIWIDEVEIRYKINNMTDEIINGIENSRIFIGCISKNYERSKSCKKEISYAQGKGKSIIIVKVDPKYELDKWLLFDFKDYIRIKIDLSAINNSVEQLSNKIEGLRTK